MKMFPRAISYTTKWDFPVDRIFIKGPSSRQGEIVECMYTFVGRHDWMIRKDTTGGKI